MDNRSQIINQALALFAERGYDAVGVQDIALAAGITKPTLYHYFGSKRGLLEALVQESYVPLAQSLNVAADYTGDLPLTLTRVVTVLFQFAQAEPLFYRMLLSTWLALPGNEAHMIVAPYHQATLQQVEQMFTAAAHDHGNMRGRQQGYAATLIGVVHTYIALALNGYITLDAALVEQAVRQFSYGIYS